MGAKLNWNYLVKNLVLHCCIFAQFDDFSTFSNHFDVFH